MNLPRFSLSPLNGIALSVLVAGLVFSAHSLLSAPSRLERINRHIAALHELGALEAVHARREQAIRDYLALSGGKPPPPIDELASATLPGMAIQTRLREPRPLAPGWALHQADVSLSEIPFELLSAFLQRATQAGPAWRLTACHFEASSRDGVAVRASLRFEAPLPSRALE